MATASEKARIRALEIELHVTRAQRDGRITLAPTAAGDVAELLIAKGIELVNGELHGPGIVGDDDAFGLARTERPTYFGQNAAGSRAPSIEALGKGIGGSSPDDKIRAANNAMRPAGVK